MDAVVGHSICGATGIVMSFTQVLLMACRFVVQLRIADEQAGFGEHNNESDNDRRCVGADVVVDHNLIDRMWIDERVACPVRSRASSSNNRAADYN